MAHAVWQISRDRAYHEPAEGCTRRVEMLVGKPHDPRIVEDGRRLHALIDGLAIHLLMHPPAEGAGWALDLVRAQISRIASRDEPLTSCSEVWPPTPFPSEPFAPRTAVIQAETVLYRVHHHAFRPTGFNTGVRPGGRLHFFGDPWFGIPARGYCRVMTINAGPDGKGRS